MKQDFYGYLIAYARRRRGKAFSPESVTLSALERGIIAGDLRATGPMFCRAEREGYIRRSTELFPRVTSNGSQRPGWVGV